MAPTGPSHVTQVRVYVADTDLMGVVYNSNYLIWFEVGRTELLRTLGMSYRAVEARGWSLPVTEAIFKVRRPAVHDDLLSVETTVQDVRSRGLTFSYRIQRDGDLLVEGATTHVPLCRETGRAGRIPEWLSTLLRPTEC